MRRRLLWRSMLLCPWGADGPFSRARVRHGLSVLWGLAAAGLLVCPAWAGGLRVASLNLCTDQLTLMLANPADIVGLSPLARDCAESVLCVQARSVPVLRPTAEAVLTARPDVVLAGDYTARLAVMAARQAGAVVVTTAPARSLEDVAEQIRRVGRAVGQPERAENLAHALEMRLAALPRTRNASSPVAAVYEANGFVVGEGSLADDVLARAGLRNFAASAGAGCCSTRLPLERLLLAHPDLLVRDVSGPGYSLAQAMLDSPVLARAFPPPHVVAVPGRLWLCGLPQTLDAVSILRDAREQLASAGGQRPPDMHDGMSLRQEHTTVEKEP
jgi:iron complex transport system substrate-binding protein